MALDIVQDYITRARVLLLDQVGPQYRYPDDDLLQALNIAVMECRRLRPDVFQTYFNATPTLPSFTTMDDAVPIDPMYRMAFVYYIVGHAQLRDDENEEDARAGMFLNKFAASLVTSNG